MEGALSKGTFKEKKIKEILYYGRHLRKMNLFGNLLGIKEDHKLVNTISVKKNDREVK